MTQRPDLPVIVISALGGAALAVMLFGGPSSTAEAPPPEAAQPAPDPSAPEAAIRLSRSFKAVAKRLRPSVLNITTERFIRERDNPFLQFMDNFFGGERQPTSPDPSSRLERSFGTGFVVRADGLALTNDHVVADAKRLIARLEDGVEVQAEVIGTDPLSDLAVLRLEPRPDGAPYVPVELGDSDGLEVGDWVLAIGNPFGLDQTVTAGIVSAKGRSRVGIAAYEDFIQTDVAINPGNSGGPLVGLDGRVVGVATAIATRSGHYQGIGFAIPIAMARDVMEDIVENGRVVRGWLGVSVQDASPELAERLGLGRRSGVLVAAVFPDSPAEAAGLLVGDLIVSLGGEPVGDSTRLRNLAARAVPGEAVRLRVVREGAEHELEVHMAERPAPAAEPGAAAPDGEAPRPREVGITARALSPELATYFGYEEAAEGVVITRVEPGSLAAQQGVRPGMILQEVNRRPIRGLEDLNAAVADVDLSEGVLLRVWDGVTSAFVLIPPLQ